MSVDASIVFLPRFTTLVGAKTFTTPPVDVTSFAGAQFQVWRGPIRTSSGSGTFKITFEESLDSMHWVQGPATPTEFDIPESDAKFFSYSFRLRWFRMSIEVAGTDPIVTAWSEGLLRGGGGGMWGAAAAARAAAAAGGAALAGGLPAGSIDLASFGLDPSLGYQGDPNSSPFAAQEKIDEMMAQAKKPRSIYGP